MTGIFKDNGRSIFLELVRNGTIGIVVRQIHNPVSFLGPLGIEGLVTSRSMNHLGCRVGKIRIIEPALKHIAISISRSSQGKCRRFDGIGNRIFTRTRHPIHFVSNRECIGHPIRIQDNALVNLRCKLILIHTFCVHKPSVKFITIICNRICRSSNRIAGTYANIIHSCPTMLIGVVGHRIGFHISPYCIQD